MKKIEDVNFSGKKVIIRCDLNVPMENGIITDDNRILQSIETIKYVYEKADRIIILSHLGRIKKADDKRNNSLKPVCERLSELLNIPVKFCTYEEDIDNVIKNNKIVMLENTRFFDLDGNKESNNDIELSKFFSSLGDIFINDAFGVSHRSCASIVGISKFLPSYMGFLVRKEIEKLNLIKDNPNKPFVVILGGAKVKDKIGIISKLIDKVDKLVIVGGMAFTFIKAMNINVGKSIVDEDNIEYAKDLLKRYDNKIILPIDVYTNLEFADTEYKKLKDINNISSDEIGLDIGPKTIDYISNNISDASTIFLNGPAGAFEFSNFSEGTKNLLDILKNMNAMVIIGGGDSASAAIKFGFKDSFTHISTGGGASLEYIEGKDLPGISCLSD